MWKQTDVPVCAVKGRSWRGWWNQRGVWWGWGGVLQRISRVEWSEMGAIIPCTVPSQSHLCQVVDKDENGILYCIGYVIPSASNSTLNMLTYDSKAIASGLFTHPVGAGRDCDLMQLGPSPLKLPHVTLLVQYAELVRMSLSLGCREVKGLVIMAGENKWWVLLQYFLRWGKKGRCPDIMIQ